MFQSLLWHTLTNQISWRFNANIIGNTQQIIKSEQRNAATKYASFSANIKRLYLAKNVANHIRHVWSFTMSVTRK